MSNNYQPFLNKFFNRLLELRHTSSHLNSVLKQTIKRITGLKKIAFVSASSLVISDWTGPTDKGWTINYHTGVSKITYIKDYEQEVELIISYQCCYSFAQSFEALETFFKDCIYFKSQNDKDYIEKIKSSVKGSINRQNIPGGYLLFKFIKLACNDTFKQYSTRNNRNIKFNEFWTVLSEVRHSVIHSSSIIEIAKLKKTDYHFDVFKYFFNYTQLNGGSIQISLDYQKLDYLIKAISEFGYQIFKVLSITDKLEWDMLTK